MLNNGLRRVMACATSYDPTTFLVGVAAWQMLAAITLLLPGSAFDASPVYALVRQWRLGEEQWGLLLAADALALLASVGPATRFRLGVPIKAAIAIASGLLQFVWGGLLLAGAAGLANGWAGIATHGFFSAGGAYTLFCGVGCWLASVQWASVDWIRREIG